MTSRLNYVNGSPDPFKSVLALDTLLSSRLEPSLSHLIKLCASQINGCAYCIDMHWKDARASGETEQRLYGLDAWRDSPYYTQKERAVLAWTDSLTLISETNAPDSDFAGVREHFDDKQLADLT